MALHTWENTFTFSGMMYTSFAPSSSKLAQTTHMSDSNWNSREAAVLLLTAESHGKLKFSQPPLPLCDAIAQLLPWWLLYNRQKKKNLDAVKRILCFQCSRKRLTIISCYWLYTSWFHAMDWRGTGRAPSGNRSLGSARLSLALPAHTIKSCVIN